MRRAAGVRHRHRRDLAEVSTFSYGGQQLLESAQSRTQSLTVTLDLPECTVYLEDVPYGWGSDNRLMDVSRLEISSDIPAGTLRLDCHIRLGRAGACGLDRLLGRGKSGVGPCELGRPPMIWRCCFPARTSSSPTSGTTEWPPMCLRNCGSW